MVNGIGGLLLMLLCVTGAIIWWPGVKAWRRSLLLQRHVSWKRFNWNLHSVMGFWSIAFLFMWAVTGAYLVFQEQLSPLIDALFPYVTRSPTRSTAVGCQLGLTACHRR